jgi:hypothetical protein
MTSKLPFSTILTIGIAMGSGFGQLIAAELPQFEKDILPVFYHHCFACHSEKQTKPKGKLRLDSVQAILESKTLVPGNPDASELLTRTTLPITHEDVMPPLKGGAQPLSETERETVQRWIAAGADFGEWQRFDHRDAPLGGPLPETPLAEITRRIDELVTAHHQRQGTELNPAVSDETFVRRLYLDVIGRIPTLSESARFLADTAPDKRSRLIDALLQSPGFSSHFFNWKGDQLRLLSQGLPGLPGWLYDDWVKEAIRSGLPYDEFVRGLINASGYLWENGAVGFYLRDLGMPLDHTSNLTRVFLGTRMECAQCHDHPLQPVTQKDFLQMAAFTAGVSNLASSSGYSEKNVKQWRELKTKLDEMKADKALRDGLSRTISFLKRLTVDTGKPLRFPDDYAYDKSLRGTPVTPQTLFGDEITVSTADPRAAFAEWLTSPRNPRFVTNIANRLWKLVMGAGLIEPVDSLSILPQTEHAALIQHLGEAMIRLRFDERRLLAALLNTRLYQSESVRESPPAGQAFDLRGPLLRRMSAEQVWDSMLALIVPDLDERVSLRRSDDSLLDPERLRRLTRMSADELLHRARDEMTYRERHREFQLRQVEQQKERAAARERGDPAAERALQAAHSKENAAFFSPELQAMQMGLGYHAKETDPRWKHLPHTFVRASETPMPLPLGHFLRQFGQSDRREIDAFNRDPNPTHSLALMNGELTGRILAKDSALRQAIAQAPLPPAELIPQIYRAILVRSPRAEEMAQASDLISASPSPVEDLIWALLNSPEFLFNQ